MASFLLYQKISIAEIKAERQKLIDKTNEFFANNPRRRIANVGVWYDALAKIRRKHVEEDVDKAIQEACDKST